MYFRLLSFVTFVSAVVAVPTILPRNQTCDPGSIFCCNQVGKASFMSRSYPEFRRALESANLTAPASDELAGLQCIPTAGQGGAVNDWSAVHLIYKYMLIVFSSSQPLCCSNTRFSTVFLSFHVLSFAHFLVDEDIVIGCSPMNIV